MSWTNAPGPGPRKLLNAEWITLDAQAARQGTPAAYRQLLAFEDQHDATQARDQTALRASRAQGRALVAEQQARAAQLRWEAFQQARSTQAVIVREDSSGDLVLARLADVTPRHRLAQAFPAAFTRAEDARPIAAALDARPIAAALDAYETRLLAQCRQAEETHRLLAAAAETRAASLVVLHPDRPLPVFTPRELNQLELHAGREPEAEKRAAYAALYRAAIHEGRGLYGVEKSPEIRLEPAHERALDFFLAAPLEERFWQSAARMETRDSTQEDTRSR